jgi:class 3 adenylate cyclase
MPETLAQKERQLDLVMALDNARDSVEVQKDPNVMFRTIVDLLKSYFNAAACGILTISDEKEAIESVAFSGTDEKTAIQLCRQTIKMETAAPLSTAQWSHTLGMRILRDEDQSTLGGLFLSRESQPFTDADIELLNIAESQIDSAVIQARMIWTLANRNRELEAIYQIDRMGDDTPNESDLIGGFTGILTDYFDADLCMVLLSKTETDELTLRGMVDKENVPLAAIDAIRKLTGNIAIPQTIQTPEAVKQLELLAAPFIVTGVRLGAVVIGRKTTFTLADHRLLHAMVSQMDSAVAHSRTLSQLSMRNRELETIYKIDVIRDKEVDFDRMLQQVLTELCKAVASELGYLMLFSESEEKQLELKATTVDGLLTSPMYSEVINRLSREALAKGEPIMSNSPEGAVRSIVAIPLILNDKIIGVFGTVNSANPRGFSVEDRRILTAITSQVDTAVFERLEQRRMRRVLSRSVDPKVLERLLEKADNNILHGERVVISVIFADLRGSTEWAERTNPEMLVNTLNAFLGRMTDVIFKHGGTLDKFVGDEVIALFGSPVAMENHALRAAKCALDMQDVHTQLQDKLTQIGLELPAMGVGVSSGEVIAGEIGTPIRTDFTAIGRVMNLGARLCGAAGPGQIYISKETHEMLGDHAKANKLDPTFLKGIGSVDAYALLSAE